MNFKNWLQQQEDVNLGGLQPDQERPVDAAISKSSGAFNKRSLTHDDDPPTPEHPWMKKMKKMKKKMFDEDSLQEGGRRTSGKTGLYALGYAGLGLYPDADYLTHSADSILYLTHDSRLYSNGDSHPFSIDHLPGHTQYGDGVNSGESKPFDISHLPGTIVPPKDSPLPGKSMPFKSFIKLVQKPKTIAPKDSDNLPD